MTSNYPPGVTGNEFAISGPDREWEERSLCEYCNHIDNNVHQEHHSEGRWFICSNCEQTTELGFLEEIEGPDPDDWRDRMLDREERFYERD